MSTQKTYGYLAEIKSIPQKPASWNDDFGTDLWGLSHNTDWQPYVRDITGQQSRYEEIRRSGSRWVIGTILVPFLAFIILNYAQSFLIGYLGPKIMSLSIQISVGILFVGFVTGFFKMTMADKEAASNRPRTEADVFFEIYEALRTLEPNESSRTPRKWKQKVNAHFRKAVVIMKYWVHPRQGMYRKFNDTFSQAIEVLEKRILPVTTDSGTEADIQSIKGWLLAFLVYLHNLDFAVLEYIVKKASRSIRVCNIKR